MRRFIRMLLLLVSLAVFADVHRASAADAPLRPNIVYILCDDLGFGDVHCLNPVRGKIPTPNFDRLATEGMAFTDAHGGSSVCSPTRYGILTGRYAWRSKLQSGVLMGDGKPLLAGERLTVATLLKNHGYATACIGKWHLGLKFGPKGYADKIADGPLEHGFDYFFGISASLDMPPFAFIDDHRFTEIPTVTKKWMRAGPAAKSFEAIDVLPTLTRKATDYIGSRAADAKAGRPFFLYLCFASPHTPILPTAEWQGKSKLNAYGDFVMQTDWSTGQVLEAIDKAGLTDNTLVVFASDNGCSPNADVKLLEAHGHYPSAQFRGYKSDIWDGGHRIPFIVRWPGQVKPSSTSDQLTCLTDLIATCADFLADKLPDNAGEDSVSILPALLGRDKEPLREAVVHHSAEGCFAIRQGFWKLEFCPGSGGWDVPVDTKATEAGLPQIQLYDMHDDVGERTNVGKQHPDIVRRLTKLLERYVSDGRSTPGSTEKNDAPIEIFKTPSAKAAAKLREMGD